MAIDDEQGEDPTTHHMTRAAPHQIDIWLCQERGEVLTQWFEEHAKKGNLVEIKVLKKHQMWLYVVISFVVVVGMAVVIPCRC